jgi:hypothetical protein
MAAKKPPELTHEVLVQRADGHQTVVRVQAPDGAKAKAAVGELAGDHRHEVVDVAVWPDVVA